ncbi:HpcH/HpaI aldolase/citrate lyase family protein [Rhodococcus aetherivorans]
MAPMPPDHPVVPATDARSWLLVSAAHSRHLGDTCTGVADAVIYDLEDGVVPSARPAAREALYLWLTRGGTGWVRINPAGSEDWNHDLDALDGAPGLLGVMLAKCESAEQVTETFIRLPAGTPVLALVESALGIERAYDIASTESTFRLAFGSGDFRRDTGAADLAPALSYARGRLVVASRAAGLPGPIDGPTLTTAEDALTDALAVSRTMGLSGKLCMHPEQAPVINRALSPTPTDIDWARDVIDQLGADGTRVRDGSDIPQLARSRAIHRLASVFARS